MEKPKRCVDCPAVDVEKGIISCGVMKSLKAKIDDPSEKLEMWKKCPLAWDNKDRIMY